MVMIEVFRFNLPNHTANGGNSAVDLPWFIVKTYIGILVFCPRVIKVHPAHFMTIPFFNYVGVYFELASISIKFFTALWTVDIRLLFSFKVDDLDALFFTANEVY